MHFLLFAFAAIVACRKTSEFKGLNQKIHSKCPGKNTYALTFADGIFNSTAYALFDALDDAKVKATFFVSGFQMLDTRNEAALKEAVRRGHKIGTLGFLHNDMTTLDDKTFDKEIKLGKKAIKEVTGVEPLYFRAPYGRISQHVLRRATELGLKTINHNVNPMDWRDGLKEREILSSIKNCVEHNDSGILLLHDLYPTTLKALPKIVKVIRNSGKKLTSIDECISPSDN
jgi:peptidoglycan/xylan/chitin deacetylase (PgdA/CDA1 family)